ncbi:MAG: hypothetical protein AMXMBFR84_05250 [Candidatus Hydrogenedentota bacterium]
MVRHVATNNAPFQYATLDDAAIYGAAVDDPQGFIRGFDGPVVIDEVQRVPDLFRAIKLAVDRDRQPGRYILTGSANVFMLPTASESLAGRMEIQTLWPFSQGELLGVRDEFVDRVFAGALPGMAGPALGRHALADILARGGYPEACTRSDAGRRGRWFANYVSSILQRDIRDIAGIDHLSVMPRLLSILAARSSTLLNYAELARSVGLPQTTLKRYCTLLETTFLLHFIPAWTENVGKRLTRSPKVCLCDTGLACHLMGIDAERMTADPTVLGKLLESFTALELMKQISWSKTRATLYHYRTAAGQEIDFLMETPDGSVACVEVKASETISKEDFRHLIGLRDQLKGRFRQGILLHAGSETVSFGDRMWAMPIASLWQGSPNHTTRD